MRVILIKRLNTVDIPNGQEYTTKRIKIENVNYISKSELGIYTILADGTTYAYDSSEYFLNAIG